MAKTRKAAVDRGHGTTILAWVVRSVGGDALSSSGHGAAATLLA